MKLQGRGSGVSVGRNVVAWKTGRVPPEQLPNHGSVSIMQQLCAPDDPENGDKIPGEFC